MIMKKLMKWISLALAAASCAMFAACAPFSLEKAKERMAKEGYTLQDMPAPLGADNCVGGILASEGLLDEDKITAYLFETADDAKAFLSSNAIKLAFPIGTPIQDGKWVYAGSEDAIEDFTEGLF
jgi:hypothetical protein